MNVSTRHFLAATAMAVLGLPACGQTGDGASALGDLPTAQPETAGFSSGAQASIDSWAAKVHSPSGLVLVGDRVIYGWGDASAKLPVHGVRRALLDALYGPAVASGQIALSTTLAQLGIDDLQPSLTATEQQATVLDLIESRSGIYHDANGDSAADEASLPPRGSHAPGTFWFSNTWDYNAAGAIYEQLTETSVFDALDAQIASPLGMQDYTPADGRYEDNEAAQSRIPEFALSMSARDMARFGLLYLHGGAWQGDQLVGADWVATSTSNISTTTTPAAGYGYGWWVADAGAGLGDGVDVGDGAFAATGTYGHAIVVLPAYDMVVVIQADDGYAAQDPAHRDIGPHRIGELLAAILSAHT
jgi:CubicO group peptidase (beta-lactamase class C family)